MNARTQHLMVGGPHDGKIASVEEGLTRIDHPDGSGVYLRIPMSNAVAIFQWTRIRRQWDKRRPRTKGFPPQKEHAKM